MSVTGGSSTVGDDGEIAEDNDAATHSGEYAARLKAAENNTAVDDAITDDPTGGKREQVAAKQAANAMGDQDEANTGYQYPSGAELPTAQNVRRYPELFDQSVIDSFNQDDPNDADDTSISEAQERVNDGEEVPMEPVGDNVGDAGIGTGADAGDSSTSSFFSSGS